MAKFLTPLVLSSVSSQGRGTWRVRAPLIYQSDLLRAPVTVPEDFVTDLASVPRLPVAYFLVGGIAHRAAVVHDWFYTSHEVSRAVADKILKEAAEADGASWWQAWLLWVGVRVGGRSSWDAAGPKQPAHIRARFKKSGD